MTYSIKVRASTKVESKRRVSAALHTQTTGQPSHKHDKVHVEKLLHAFIDACNEDIKSCVIVVDAYGFVTSTLDSGVTTLASNVKVYSAPRQSGDDELEKLV